MSMLNAATQPEVLQQAVFAFRPFVVRRAPPQTADDILQDAFAVAQQSASQLRDPRKLKPWIFAIIRNAISRHQAHNSPRRGEAAPTLSIVMERVLSSPPLQLDWRGGFVGGVRRLSPSHACRNPPSVPAREAAADRAQRPQHHKARLGIPQRLPRHPVFLLQVPQGHPHVGRKHF
jgi:DNA-directed RNA polymerase specialized sigma24 family protein